MPNRISFFLLLTAMFAANKVCGQYTECFTRQSLLTMQKSSLDKVRVYLSKNLYEFDDSRSHDNFIYDGYSINYGAIYWNRPYPSAEFILYSSSGKSNIIIHRASFYCFNEILTTYSSVLKGTTEVENGELYTKFKDGNVVTEFRESGGEYSNYTIVLYNETELKKEVKLQKELDEAMENAKQEQERMFEITKQEADSFFDAGKYDEAKRIYTRANDIKSDNYVLFRIDLCDERICNQAIGKADSAFLAKRYEEAIAAYNNVLDCAKNKTKIQEKIKQAEIAYVNEKVSSLMKTADLNFDYNKFDIALNYYTQVLQLDPLNQRAQEKVKRINIIKDVLAKRSTTVFSYSSLNPDAFRRFRDTVLSSLGLAMADKRNGNIRLSYQINFDTLGKNNSTATIPESSQKGLGKDLNTLIRNKCLTPTSEVGFFLASYEKQDVDLKWNYKTLTCKSKYGTVNLSNDDYTSSGIVRPYILNSDNPHGKFTFGVLNKELNGQKFTDVSLLKYRPKGPFNALHSVLIPGWGSHIVSNGEVGKKRLKSFLWCVGVASILKLYTNAEYEKYKNATDQDEMDRFYSNANKGQKLFLLTGGIGLSIYVYDIYWAFRKGLKNYKSSSGLRVDLRNQPRKILNQPLKFK